MSPMIIAFTVGSSFVRSDVARNVPQGLWTPSWGTMLYKVKYDFKVQIVLQDTSIVTIKEHPMHVHGFHFFVFDFDFGNFNLTTNSLKLTHL
ncbi:unnamed protein product [Sphenostylis stenocarpa]|uniref:Plastocyanin-like domain-containing protein n=1 Tax=Sphenostylis stenocarpa TaxID=92480 RepID=A0AA86SY71_9FABA|nr:unnamed protein product [Sphenostylis stenocarpa]